MKHDPLTCIVCGAKIPFMPRAKALQKGAAATVKVDDGEERTYYRCIGRHSADEFLRAIGLKPRFVRASKAGC